MPLTFQQLRDFYTVEQDEGGRALLEQHKPDLVADIDALRADGALPPMGRLEDPTAITAKDFRFAMADQATGAPPGRAAAVAGIESAFREDVISGKRLSSTGAKGLMQFMPETGAAFGLTPDNWTEPTRQIEAYTNYLSKELLPRYRGDWRRALAHYNGGGKAPTSSFVDYADKILRQQGDGSPATTTTATTTTPPPTASLGERLVTQEPLNDLDLNPLARAGASAVQRASGAVQQFGEGVKRLGRVALTPPADDVPAFLRAVDAIPGGRIARQIPETGKAALELAAPLTGLAILPAAGVEGMTGSKAAGDLTELLAGLTPYAAAKTLHTMRKILPAERLNALVKQFGLENLMRGVGDIGAAADRADAITTRVGPATMSLLDRTAEHLTKAAHSAQRKTRRLAKQEGFGKNMTTLDDAPPPPMDPLTGELRAPRETIPGQPAQRFFNEEVGYETSTRAIPPKTRPVPIAKVGRGSPALQSAQRHADDLAGQATDFERVAGKYRKLGRYERYDLVEGVAGDTQLLSALRGLAKTPADRAVLDDILRYGEKSNDYGIASGIILDPQSTGLTARLVNAVRLMSTGGMLHGGAGGNRAQQIAGGVAYISQSAIVDGVRRIVTAAAQSPKINRTVALLNTLDPTSDSFRRTALKLGGMLQRQTRTIGHVEGEDTQDGAVTP